MQDNLEFLQWSKRYWDQYYPGGEYDALARRKGAGGAPAAAAPTPVSSRTSGAGVGATNAARRGNTPTTTTSGARGVRPAAGGASAAVIAENTQLKQTVEGLERERDFYFSKLRDIELLLQQAIEQDPKLEEMEDGLVKSIQTILYSTEVRLGRLCCSSYYAAWTKLFFYRKDLRYQQKRTVEWWMIRKRFKWRDSNSMYNEKPGTDVTS